MISFPITKGSQAITRIMSDINRVPHRPVIREYPCKAGQTLPIQKNYIIFFFMSFHPGCSVVNRTFLIEICFLTFRNTQTRKKWSMFLGSNIPNTDVPQKFLKKI